MVIRLIFWSIKLESVLTYSLISDPGWSTWLSRTISFWSYMVDLLILWGPPSSRCVRDASWPLPPPRPVWVGRGFHATRRVGASGIDLDRAHWIARGGVVGTAWWEPKFAPMQKQCLISFLVMYWWGDVPKVWLVATSNCHASNWVVGVLTARRGH